MMASNIEKTTVSAKIHLVRFAPFPKKASRNHMGSIHLVRVARKSFKMLTVI